VDEPVSEEVLNALAHPLRLAALVALEGHDRTPTDLAAALGVREPVLMEHLHQLDTAGLVTIAFDTGLIHARIGGWSAIAAQMERLQEGSRGDQP
jgi:DNA-binding transcriptional ArsR family regulator